MNNYILRLNNIINNNKYLILKNTNIIGMGLGNKIINGKITNIPSLTFLVKKKYSLNSLAASYQIPKMLFGVYTDIIEVEKKNITPSILPYTNKVRPAVGGVSIETMKNTFGGTLGYPVTDQKKKDIFILTGPGVISDDLLGRPRDNVYQPSKYFATSMNLTQEERVGEFKTAIKVNLLKAPDDTDPKSFNSILGEIAYVGVNSDYTKKKFVKPALLDGTIVTKVKESEMMLAETVRFIGAKSGIVKATIVSKNFSGILRVTHKNVLDVLIGISGAIHIQCSRDTAYDLTPSDVGALVVDNKEPNKAVGLLVAGLGKAGVVCPIKGILENLKVSLLVD